MWLKLVAVCACGAPSPGVIAPASSERHVRNTIAQHCISNALEQNIFTASTNALAASLDFQGIIR